MKTPSVSTWLWQPQETHTTAHLEKWAQCISCRSLEGTLAALLALESHLFISGRNASCHLFRNLQNDTRNTQYLIQRVQAKVPPSLSTTPPHLNLHFCSAREGTSLEPLTRNHTFGLIPMTTSSKERGSLDTCHLIDSFDPRVCLQKGCFWGRNH